MKDFTQWIQQQVISLIPTKKKKKSINEEGQDQQPEVTLNASCKLFHCSHTVLLYVCLPSSSLYLRRLTIKQLSDQMLYSRQVDSTTQTPMSRVRGGWRAAALPALLLLLVCSLFQRALRSGRALEPLGGNGRLVGHALPHHVAFPPQCDLLQKGEKTPLCLCEPYRKL